MSPQLLTTLDVYTSINTVVTIFLVGKYPKAWLAYAVGNIAFVAVCLEKHLLGLTCMGVILFFVGLNNYRLSRKR